MTTVGWFRDGPIPLRFQGGVARSAGVVSKRSRSLLICPRSDPYFLLEITNHPVCAAKERGLFIHGAATPPLKGGEWIRLATNHSPSAPDRNLIFIHRQAWSPSSIRVGSQKRPAVL